jgi:hypothetical protein
MYLVCLAISVSSARAFAPGLLPTIVVILSALIPQLVHLLTSQPSSHLLPAPPYPEPRSKTKQKVETHSSRQLIHRLQLLQKRPRISRQLSNNLLLIPRKQKRHGCCSCSCSCSNCRSSPFERRTSVAGKQKGTVWALCSCIRDRDGDGEGK